MKRLIRFAIVPALLAVVLFGLQVPQTVRACYYDITCELTSANPTFQRPGAATGGMYYDARSFTVDSNVDITGIEMSSTFSGVLVLYKGSFDPANPTANLVGSGTAGVSFAGLTPGDYVLVITTATAGETGEFAVTVHASAWALTWHDLSCSGGVTPSSISDGRINSGHGDAHLLITPAQNSKGNPALHLYCVDNRGNGTPAIVVDEDEYPKLSKIKTPPKNTKIFTLNKCDAPVSFYILTTGEYQINIGPDKEGKVDVVIFTDLTGENVYFQHIDPQEELPPS